MPLLNYSTQVDSTKTVGEIQTILAKHGARRILVEYSDNGQIDALTFSTETPYGDISFRLPVDPNAVLKVMSRQRISRGKLTREHATRVAWRIIKDWVAAQMAILETEMVSMEQIFLPYAVMPNGKTVFDVVMDTHFLLDAPT